MANKTPYQTSTCALVQSCANKFARSEDLFLAAYELSSAQYRVLDLVNHHQPLSSAELSRLAGMDSGAMARMIDRLASKSIVERKADAKDARSRVLTLSPKGKRIIAEVCALVFESDNSVGLLDETELGELNRLLLKLEAGLEGAAVVEG